MKTSRLWWIGALLVLVLLLAMVLMLTQRSQHASAKAHSPDLEYLKAVNSVAPPKDPELLFILMTEFANANLQEEGAEFLARVSRQFEPKLTPVQKSLYLGIIGLLRAQHASSVPLLKRYGYVKDTIATLDQAKQFSGGQVFVVNWIAGLVHTELPGFFDQRKAAREELTWCVEHVDKAPHTGWLREVYFISANSRAAMATRPRPRIIYGAVAIPTSITRSPWQRHFPRTSLRSCVCAEAHYRDRSRSRLRAVRLRIHGILLCDFQGSASTHRH